MIYRVAKKKSISYVIAFMNLILLQADTHLPPTLNNNSTHAYILADPVPNLIL